MKIALFVSMIFGIGLIALLFSGEVVPTKSQQLVADSESVQHLSNRISELEEQVADLQKQIKELQSKSRVITVPVWNSRMPPGAKPHDLNGFKYWTIPIN